MLLYLCIGIIVAIIFEALMINTNLNNDISVLERIFWVLFWPFFTFIFISKIKNN
jgi:hypothetical protein